MNYGKLAPALALALEDYHEGGRRQLASHVNLLGLVSVEAETPKPARVVMFLHCAPDTAQHAFADLGVELNQGDGPVRTGIVPLDALDALTEREAVQRVVPGQRLKPLMDVAAPAVGIPALRYSGLTGRGVIVGIIDSGIDVKNPAFEDRVLRVWDQTLPGPGVPEGPYGAEFTGGLMQVSQDTNGHGTHVAGIAAGNDPTYTGVAPEAEILVVKTDLQTPHIADAVRYIFRVAGELERPAVVNLSLGGHSDAHDGTDSLSMVIDAAGGPGRIVCCAAGNEGNDNIHARVDVNRLRTLSCVLTVAPPGEAPVPSWFNGWYDGRDRMEIAVVDPSGQATPYQPIIATGSPSRTYRLPNGMCRIITPGPDPANDDVNFVVQILPAPEPNTPNPHSWKIRIKGTDVTDGRVDVWSVDEAVAQFAGGAVDDTLKVGAPGCATQAVTVASYTTKTEWIDVTSQEHQSGETLQTISSFSSEGPRRDGVRKPDVAAPGSVVVSAMSSHAPGSADRIIDAWNRVGQGTSMACPFIAGTVALLLQRDPKLDPEGAKELLREHSSIPNQPEGAWDRKWGYGLIDANSL